MKRNMSVNNSGVQEVFDDGYYPGVIVGIMDCEQTFKDETSVGSKFIIQIKDDNGLLCYKTSKQFKFSLNEKGNLCQWCSKIFGVALDQSAVYKALCDNGFYDSDGCLDDEKFLGMKCTVYISMQVSKKDPSKSFATVESILCAKGKYGTVEPDPSIKIPSWIVEVNNGKCNNVELLNGFKIREKFDNPSAPTQQAPSEQKDVEYKRAPVENDEIPF